jgi:DNA-directed RNA polymerase subunit M/transcription elongation factor TFIIS
MFNLFNKNKIIKNKTNGVEVMKTIGEFTCCDCNHTSVNPNMLEIDHSDDSKGSLIYCEKCEAYRKWT